MPKKRLEITKNPVATAIITFIINDITETKAIATHLNKTSPAITREMNRLHQEEYLTLDKGMNLNPRITKKTIDDYFSSIVDFLIKQAERNSKRILDMRFNQEMQKLFKRKLVFIPNDYYTFLTETLNLISSPDIKNRLENQTHKFKKQIIYLILQDLKVILNLSDGLTFEEVLTHNLKDQSKKIRNQFPLYAEEGIYNIRENEFSNILRDNIPYMFLSHKPYEYFKKNPNDLNLKPIEKDFLSLFWAI